MLGIFMLPVTPAAFILVLTRRRMRFAGTSPTSTASTTFTFCSRFWISELAFASKRAIFARISCISACACSFSCSETFSVCLMLSSFEME